MQTVKDLISWGVSLLNLSCSLGPTLNRHGDYELPAQVPVHVTNQQYVPACIRVRELAVSQTPRLSLPGYRCVVETTESGISLEVFCIKPLSGPSRNSRPTTVIDFVNINTIAQSNGYYVLSSVMQQSLNYVQIILAPCRRDHPTLELRIRLQKLSDLVDDTHASHVIHYRSDLDLDDRMRSEDWLLTDENFEFLPILPPPEEKSEYIAGRPAREQRMIDLTGPGDPDEPDDPDEPT